ncbi:MAG TPA: error-prone DNA polymerase [Myxococcota bacterium]|nr:error-prone DNA polymerase [Myxococcota bacterium]
MSSRSDYVELRCRSAFSFLEACSNPEDLIECAARLGYPALALADRAGLYGAPRFHQAAVAAGVRAIVGAELDVARDDAGDAPDALPGSAPDALLLLVESARGYRNLCRLVTEGHAHAGKQDCRVRWDELESHAAGLVALVRGDARLRPALLSRARGVFRERLWVDVSRHATRAGEVALRRAAALAESARVPVVATHDVRHARPEGRALFDALTCLRHKTSLDRAGRLLAENAERHLRAPEEMERRFSDHPEWIRASRAIAERCAFTLEHLGYRFPEFPIPHGESQASFLRLLVEHGARHRYGSPVQGAARRQLERELAVIEKLDLCGYFLIVHDIARFAREEGILSQGRGSAANSAVCYALGITAVDPVSMGLLFERFLSEERGEWPDIDIDLPSGDQRERLIQYVFRKYGASGAAMTAVVISYRTRLAVREMGKVLGLGEELVGRLAGLLSSLEHRDDLETPASTLRQAGVDPTSPRVAQLLGLVDAVRGLPRHLGQHTGGIVIAAGRLDEVVPIEPARMADRRVIQWDKEDCADLGLIKIDLLGLGMLAALEDSLEQIRVHEGCALDLARLPPDDPETYAMIRAADTIGTFQIESRAQMATLPRMRPERFYDLVVEVAIIRPGPIVGKMVNPYLARRAGREAVRYPDPCLEPILARTLGVPLFQEQLLRIAMTAAGFTGGEAEELRRAMGFKRSVERMHAIERRLVDGMRERGIPEAAQEEILRGITSFALYGFPESHAASFALIAYASAFLKRHHPAAFLAGLLNAQPMGFYSPATLVKDAQRHGVRVLPIDVARSEWDCRLEGGNPTPSVRLGLRCVAGLQEETGRALVEARRRAPFGHVADLCARVPLRRDEIDTLAELGALASIDSAAKTRRAALWQVAALERDPRSLFAGVPPPSAESPLPEMSPIEETLADYRRSGLTTGSHVMSFLRPQLAARGVLRASDLSDVPDGRFVRTAGHCIVRQRPGSAKGFCFLTLEDETGTSNAVLTPRIFRRFRVALHGAAIVEVAGPLQHVDGVIHVRVHELRALAAGASLPRSHDYR